MTYIARSLLRYAMLRSSLVCVVPPGRCCATWARTGGPHREASSTSVPRQNARWRAFAQFGQPGHGKDRLMISQLGGQPVSDWPIGLGISGGRRTLLAGPIILKACSIYFAKRKNIWVFRWLYILPF